MFTVSALYPRIILCDFEFNINNRTDVVNRTNEKKTMVQKIPFYVSGNGMIWRHDDLKSVLNVNDTLYYSIISVIRKHPKPGDNEFRSVFYESRISHKLVITEKHMINRQRIE